MPEVCWEGPRERKGEVLRLHEFQHMFVSLPPPVKQKLPHLAPLSSVFLSHLHSLTMLLPPPLSFSPSSCLPLLRQPLPTLPAQTWLNWVVCFGCRYRLHLFTCSPGSYPHLEVSMCFLFKHSNLNSMNWYLRFVILSAWASSPSFFYNSAFIIIFFS